MSIIGNPSYRVSRTYADTKPSEDGKIHWPMTLQDLIDEVEDQFGEDTSFGKIYVYVHVNKGSKKSAPTGLYVQRV